MINPDASAGNGSSSFGLTRTGIAGGSARPIPHVLGFTKLYLCQFGGALPTWSLNLYRTHKTSMARLQSCAMDLQWAPSHGDPAYDLSNAAFASL
jgi:hypothetical protein